MPMSPRLLRPRASGGFPIAQARDGSNNVIAATDYTDASGRAWRVHVFNTSGTLDFTRGGQVEYLIVGGGGGGSGAGAVGQGGGGAGGLLTNVGGSPLAVIQQTYNVVVGAGGNGGAASPTARGDDGNPSSFAGVQATGGGGGALGTAGRSGGSGSGAGPTVNSATANTGGAGTAGQGTSGGNSFNSAGLNQDAGGGGGGGASQAGGSAAVGQGGKGGDGTASSITGSSVTYAGGGGGGMRGVGASGGAGGAGGGGRGSSESATRQNGTANTGGGGGGGGGTASSSGGNGGSGIVIVRYRRTPPQPTNPWDLDALSYLSAVEAADSAPLEHAVRDAINTFIIGCKADGIWSAIKASCILMGARTLSGALTPLVGTAPTNVNFVSGDYNRKTGLVGNGTTKYLNSNRNNNADGQDDQHSSVYVSTAHTSAADGFPVYIGSGASESGSTHIGRFANNGVMYSRNRSATFTTHGAGSGAAVGFVGMSRAGSGSYDIRLSTATSSVSVASQTPLSAGVFVFASNQFGGVNSNSYSNARLAFYSIGSSVNLGLLDTRLTTLYNAIGAAIP